VKLVNRPKVGERRGDEVSAPAEAAVSGPAVHPSLEQALAFGIQLAVEVVVERELLRREKIA
jgi:hypothetical protein